MKMNQGHFASILSKKTYTTFDGTGSLKNLSGLCIELLSEQKKAWLDLREGYASLKNIRERALSCRGFSVRLQHNPGRIKNSLADVGEIIENERRCFLCMDHLPEEQKGILYRSEYLILCNPRPVFSSHFTISHSVHRRQAIAEHIDIFLQIMSDFGSHFTVLYNGPRCGASAPDHLHFQAVPSGQMPIEREIHEETKSALISQVDGVLLYRARDLGREVIILEGGDPMVMGVIFNRFLDAFRKVLHLDEEPMLNVAGLYGEGRWRLVIFLRRKHRPDLFFAKGDAQVVVSPGAIDMGGVLITPIERDFERLDAASVEGIYGEVSLEGETVTQVMEQLK